jgi:S1-C subfamily serine protease
LTVVAQDKTIDLMILSIGIEKEKMLGLSAGSGDDLKHMEHVAVAGFPNYRIGDTGVIIPGLVVGFRMVSGIRRILTNAPIVAGNSGGPVIGSNNRVIGIAVTGAERMDRAQETEDHGIVPIDALKYLR